MDSLVFTATAIGSYAKYIYYFSAAFDSVTKASLKKYLIRTRRCVILKALFLKYLQSFLDSAGKKFTLGRAQTLQSFLTQTTSNMCTARYVVQSIP